MNRDGKNKDESTEVLIPWHKWHAGGFQIAHNAMMKMYLCSGNAVCIIKQ